MNCFSAICRRERAKGLAQTFEEVGNEDFTIIRDVNVYSYRELKLATKNFHQDNKIGEGGFGVVYKERV
eukprot:Gb_23804 [translate_table: standard]